MMRSRSTRHGRIQTPLWAATLAIGAAIGIAASLPAPRAFAQSVDRPAALHDPNNNMQLAVALPILNFQGEDDVCDAWIEVQYLGGGSAGEDPGRCDNAGVKALLVVWGAPGFCPPQSAGPMTATCTGLLRPGAGWTISSASGWGSQNGIPTGSRSGMLFQFSARRMSEIGLDDDLGFDDVAADFLCEELFLAFALATNGPDEYRRFLKAYREGGAFRGVPLSIVAGRGRLAASVRRRCPSDAVSGATLESSYAGIPYEGLGWYDPVLPGFSYALPLVVTTVDRLHTAVYAQNAGLDCAEVEIWFRDVDTCAAARLCGRQSVAPGETVALSLDACTDPGAQGSAWVRASEPLAIAADVIGPEVMTTYVGQVRDTFDRLVRSEHPSYRGRRSLFGPLILKQADGWSTELHVQNLDRRKAARVAVRFHASDGNIVTVLNEWLCPGGSSTISPAAIRALPAGWIGSVAVESRAWWIGDGQTVQPADLAAVAVLHRSDGGTTGGWTDNGWTEAAAYGLFPEAMHYDRNSTFQEAPQGAARLAIPALSRSGDGRGVSSSITVINLVPEIGLTQVGLYLYDQNSLFDQACLRLANHQTVEVDLDRWGFVSPGFRGSALINASWSLQHSVSLGAMVLDRAVYDAPGDTASATEALAVDGFYGDAGAFCDGSRFLPPCEGN